MVIVHRITPKKGVYVPAEVMELLYSRAIDPVSFAFLCGLMDAPDEGRTEHTELTARLGYSRDTWHKIAKVLRRLGALADRIARRPEGGGFVNLGLRVRWPSAAPWPPETIGDLTLLPVDSLGKIGRDDPARPVDNSTKIDRITDSPDSGKIQQKTERIPSPKTETEFRKKEEALPPVDNSARPAEPETPTTRSAPAIDLFAAEVAAAAEASRHIPLDDIWPGLRPLADDRQAQEMHGMDKPGSASPRLPSEKLRCAATVAPLRSTFTSISHHQDQGKARGPKGPLLRACNQSLTLQACKDA